MRWFELNDITLLERIGRGHEASLEELYRRHGQALLAYLNQQLSDSQLAEETLQDVMVEVWKSAKRFRAESSVRTWLFSIARYKAMRLRQHRRPQAYPIEDEALISDHDTPIEMTELRLQSAQVRQAIAQLSDEHREVLDMVYYYDLSGQETADVLGIPLGTLKSRLSRAKTALRKLLQSVLVILMFVGVALVIRLGQTPDSPPVIFHPHTGTPLLPTHTPTLSMTITTAPTVTTTATPTATLAPTSTSTTSPTPTERSYIIAFDDGHHSDIFIMSTDKQEAQNLTQNLGADYGASWSPDGQSIVFTSGRGDASDLYIMDADGSNVRQLTDTPNQFELDAAWSPDGQTIAFTGIVDGTSSAVYLINPDGTNLRRLTNTSHNRSSTPVWMDNGRKILFMMAPYNSDGNLRPYVMNPDGSDIQEFPLPHIGTAGHAMSPNGRYMAYSDFNEEGEKIIILDLETQANRILLDRPEIQTSPAWSPDGQWMTFTQQPEVNALRTVCFVRIDGTDHWCLPDTTETYNSVYRP